MNVTDENPAAQRQYPLGTRMLRPLHDRVLVRRIDDEAPPVGGVILLPETAQAPSRRGLVVAVGPGKQDEYGHRQPLDVAIGQTIVFGRYTDFDDGRHLIIQEADIVGVEPITHFSERKPNSMNDYRQQDNPEFKSGLGGAGAAGQPRIQGGEQQESQGDDPKQLLTELTAYIKAHVADPHEPQLWELMQRIDKVIGPHVAVEDTRTDQERGQQQAEGKE